MALYFLPDPKLVELGIIPAADHDAVVRARVRGVHAQRAGAAAAGARGHADRGRPHAEPADDRALADGEHKGDRGAHPRRQALPRDGRSRRIPRRAWGGCWPKSSGSSQKATPRPRRSCSTPTGSISTPTLRDEVVKRVDALKLPSYTGFVMPKLTAVTGADGTITDVTISYPQDLTTQMLEYSGVRRADARGGRGSLSTTRVTTSRAYEHARCREPSCRRSDRTPLNASSEIAQAELRGWRRLTSAYQRQRK